MNIGCLHAIFIGLHILAFLFGFFGLIITIPLHIIVVILMQKQNKDNKKDMGTGSGKYCSKCGSESAEGVKFCASCGEEI